MRKGRNKQEDGFGAIGKDETTKKGTKINAYGMKLKYKQWCVRHDVRPETDIMKAFTNMQRSKKNVDRFSICHSMMQDGHFQSIINICASDVGQDIGEVLLNHNQLENEQVIEFIERVVIDHDKMVSIELFGNEIGDETCPTIKKLLLRNVMLKRLKLGDNSIGEEGARLIAEGLARNSTLVQLHLGGNQIGDEGVAHLARALKVRNRTLTSLGIRNNHIGVKGITHLADTLATPGCILSDIQLKGNDLCEEACKEIARGLMHNESLKVLELQNNRIGSKGVKALCAMLALNQHIHALNFNANAIDDKGITHLANLLKQNSSITTIGLATNDIEWKGAYQLVSTLKYSNVSGLDLGNNNLGPKGAIMIADILRDNTILISLDLRNCNIGSEGVCALAEMAKENTTLCHLDIGSNMCGNEGAIAWAKTLSRNQSLTRLCLTDNNITNPGGLALAKALQKNNTLRNFSYGGQAKHANHIDGHLRKVIDSITTENKKLFLQLLVSADYDNDNHDIERRRSLVDIKLPNKLKYQSKLQSSVNSYRSVPLSIKTKKNQHSPPKNMSSNYYSNNTSNNKQKNSNGNNHQKRVQSVPPWIIQESDEGAAKTISNLITLMVPKNGSIGKMTVGLPSFIDMLSLIIAKKRMQHCDLNEFNVLYGALKSPAVTVNLNEWNLSQSTMVGVPKDWKYAKFQNKRSMSRNSSEICKTRILPKKKNRLCQQEPPRQHSGSAPTTPLPDDLLDFSLKEFDLPMDMPVQQQQHFDQYSQSTSFANLLAPPPPQQNSARLPPQHSASTTSSTWNPMAYSNLFQATPFDPFTPTSTPPSHTSPPSLPAIASASPPVSNSRNNAKSSSQTRSRIPWPNPFHSWHTSKH